MSTDSRLRYAAGLMLAAEDRNVLIIPRRGGKIFVAGEDEDVKRVQPEMCRFRAEISYLLASTKLQTESIIKRAMASPAGERWGTK